MTESLIPVSRTAIKYLFGPGVRPLAFVRIKTEVKRDIQLDLAVDTFLLTNGAPVGIADTLERYNRPTPGPDEDLLKPPVAAAATDAKEEDTEATIEKAANDLRAAQDKADAAAAKLQSLALRQFATANARDFQPVVTRINLIADLDDKQLQDAALVKFKRDLPGMLTAMNVAPAKVKVLADAMAAALFNGVAIGAVQTHETAENANPNHDKGGRFTSRANAQQKKGEAAMHTAITRKTDVPDAMHHPELGSIDFRYGHPGTAEKKFGDGAGIAKVLAKHSEAEARMIPAAIAHGTVNRAATRVHIAHGDMRVLLVNNFHGEPSNHWVLTGYEKNE